ncbi:MAG: hypothetical protein B7Y36_18890, partial [Novosphingobium sp. 28-62-57]
MTAPIPTRRMYRMLAAVEAERGVIIPFPENRVSPAPSGSTRCDGPAPDLCVMPPVPDQDAGPSPSLSPAPIPPVPILTAPLPPHVGPWQRRLPDLHVLIEAPQAQPLDPEKLAAIECPSLRRDIAQGSLQIRQVLRWRAQCAIMDADYV